MSHTVPEQAPPQQDRSIPWRRILAEGAVIVASILLALAGDAWWGGVQDRQDERALAESLLEEFLDSRPGLEERVLLARRMAAGNATLLEILDPEAGGRTRPVPDSLVFAVLGGPTYEPATSSLDAALASGEIELLRSPELRAALADWRRKLADTAEDEREVRQITNEQVVPILSRSLNLAPYLSGVLSWSGGDPYGPGRTIQGRAPAPVDGEAVLPVSTDLVGALALRQFYVEFSAADLSELLVVLDQVIGLLRAELDA